jgi:CubicO group peptidase (beta-lactamase class C family)
MNPVPVTGYLSPVLRPMTSLLERLGAELGSDKGYCLAILRRGELLADIAIGDIDPARPHLLFSATKGITAVVAAMAEERGLIDLDEPIYHFWPEFDRPETVAITTRMVLSHRSGIASLDVELTLDDLIAGRDEDAVAAQRPYWIPGSCHGYHAFTFGPLMRGIFRRKLGIGIAGFLQDNIAKPLGIALSIGASADTASRITPIISSSHPVVFRRTNMPASTTARLAARIPDLFSDLRFLGLEIPSSSGIGTALALAQFWDAVLTPGLLVLPETLQRMAATQSSGVDRSLGFWTEFGSGVQLPFPQFPMLGPSSIGHEGAAGAVAFADRGSGLAVGFTTNSRPASDGAAPGLLAVLGTIRHLMERKET